MKRQTKLSRSNTLSLAISLGEWKSRIILLMLICCALTLLLFNRSDNPVVVGTRSVISDLVAPALEFFAQPVQSIHHFIEQWGQWQNIYAQNEQLRLENTKLKRWHQLAAELQAENKELRHLLKLVPVQSGHFISGKMLGNLAGSFSQSQFLSIGQQAGVLKNMTVMSGDGLVGRVMEVGKNTSRVMLITDINSHIAVITQHGREHAVAIGRNNALLELRYLPTDTTVQPGEMVVTSGDADLMPSGIPLGTVAKVSRDHVLVKPIVDWSRLSYVSLIAP